MLIELSLNKVNLSNRQIYMSGSRGAQSKPRRPEDRGVSP